MQRKPAFCSRSPALEGKVRSGEKKAEALVKEKMRMEVELESMTKKSHDASGQLVHISQELLKKERYYGGEAISTLHSAVRNYRADAKIHLIINLLMGR